MYLQIKVVHDEVLAGRRPGALEEHRAARDQRNNDHRPVEVGHQADQCSVQLVGNGKFILKNSNLF